MSDPREDDLRTTYEAVSDELQALAATEREKQIERPGTPRHARLARKAKAHADALRTTTAIEAELATDLEEDPGPGPS